MKALVIGFGSIGARHASVLKSMGFRVAIVSRREIDCPFKYKTIKEALESEKSEYVVIANQTGEHFETLLELADQGFQGKVLVEKPLFNRVTALPKINLNAFVGYNLRFNPIIQKLRNMVQQEKVISTFAYVGQYLPSWRPGKDYRESYSARGMRGGGVLRDLSHELDYISWIFGKWINLTAIGGKYSTLEIDSDDVFSIQMETCNCPIVSLQMNYLDRLGRRKFIVNTDNHSYEADLIHGTLAVDGELETCQVDRDYSYREQHKALWGEDYTHLCKLEDGMNIVKMIEAIELSSITRKWIINE